MPNIKSAKKRLRQDVKRRAQRRQEVSTLRTQVKKMRSTLSDGDSDKAEKTLAETYKALDRAAAKGLIKKNKASRDKGRLTRKVNALKG